MQDEQPCRRRATHLSRIDANEFHEDPRANSRPCGEVNEGENLKYFCEGCLYRSGRIW